MHHALRPMQRYLRLPLLPLIAVLILIATIGLVTVQDYGFSTDEPVEMYLVWENYDVVTSGKPITSPQKRARRKKIR